MDTDALQIRSLHTLDEMYQAVELQKVYWGDAIESLVPGHMLYSIVKCGGHVLAAFDGARMIGVLIGLLGTDLEVDDRPAMANLCIASKRMVVLPDYRGAGIGYHLKLAQREAALRQSIRLVTWTFDPLLTPNAHLNLNKLRCISQKYIQNYYGEDTGHGLTILGASDRLAVEWWITSRRVREQIAGLHSSLTLDHYLNANATIVNEATLHNSQLYPSDTLKMPAGVFALLEVPLDYREVVEEDESLAQSWRQNTRAAFQHLTGQGGYIVTDFLRGEIDGHTRGFYVLSYNSGFSSNPN